MVETVNNSSIDKEPQAPNSTDLRTLDGAVVFYDHRYRKGYMAEWPQEKLARVGKLLRELELPSQGRALDFGCGAGVFTAILKSALPNWEIHGTDISTEALGAAQLKLPDCHFHRLSDCAKLYGTFDLVFSHHVLEHVSNLSETAEFIREVLKPRAAMFHILPCGDSGSLEHYVCQTREAGIQHGAESRFFFEEEGHLRRLTTERLAHLWAGDGFRVQKAYYANQFFGAIRSLTESDPGFIYGFANPDACIRLADRGAVGRLRLMLLGVWGVRKPIGVVRNKLTFGCKGFRDYCLLGLASLAYPVAKFGDILIRVLEQIEWSRRRTVRGGSEMYVYLVRPVTDASEMRHRRH